jgi:3-hydroxyacyl-CoA dehydrogenase/enoyl-CoA hydratase/3-hydroxybutyryl-CoA epimerase
MPEVKYYLDAKSKVARFMIDTAGPVNSIGQQFMTDLEKATLQANRDNARGVIIVSGKKKSFLDGANLREIMTDATPQLIRITLRRFHDCLVTLAKSPFPVVAIIDGQTALGGGFELLLWGCDQVFTTADSRMGLPEVSVGLFPAGGGTQVLRRVVGFKTAVDMITSARVSSAETFAQTGLVTLCPSSELESRAMEWIESHQGIVNHIYDPAHVEPDQRSEEENQKIVNQAYFRASICPHRPYLRAAVQSMEAGLKLPLEEALRNDLDLFVSLFESPNTKNKIDFFFLTTGLGPRLVKADPRKAVKVDSLAVIGAGLMGRGIAQIAAEKGIRTLLIDVDEAATQAAMQEIDKTLEGLVSKGRWSRSRKDKVMINLEGSTDYGRLREVPLVIECVFEDLPLKQKILARVQEANPEVIFASNTSTLPMAEISANSTRPEQVVGMHFFSPVPLMPLLEVIRGPRSSAAAVATAVTVGRAIGKTVILVNDGPGFYTSRTFATFVNNGFLLAERGVLPWDVDLMALQAGFPQGPLNVYGTTGGNVVYHAGSFMASRFPERLRLPGSLKKLHEAGYVGLGKPAFYLDHRNMIRDESVLEHLVRTEGVPVPNQEEVHDILLLGMCNEAFWCMSDGVLPDYYSMDLGAVLGIGFPDCWHGPARYVSLRGVKAVRARLRELADRFHMPSLTPAPEFDQLVACGLDRSLI